MAFENLSLPQDASLLLRDYSEARNAIYEKILRGVNEDLRIDHPVYASHPIFVHEESDVTEGLLVAYLERYIDLTQYIRLNHKKLDWTQLFVLTYLDCAVHWDESPMKNALFFKGWDDIASRTLDFIISNGGIWHLWGHSWEIEEYDAWHRLEEVLIRITDLPQTIKRVSNSELLLA